LAHRKEAGIDRIAAPERYFHPSLLQVEEGLERTPADASTVTSSLK
jgi:hypothetical protein